MRNLLTLLAMLFAATAFGQPTNLPSTGNQGSVVVDTNGLMKSPRTLTMTNAAVKGSIRFQGASGSSNFLSQSGSSLVISNAYRATNVLTFDEDLPSWFFWAPAFFYNDVTVGPGAGFKGDGSGLSNVVSSGGNFMQILTNSPTLYVSTNGSDLTGTRGRLDLPFRTPMAAVSAASPEDLVWLHPGRYDCWTNCISGRNVHWYMSPGASLTWSNSTMTADAYCLFDDRKTGASTNHIMGYGRFFGNALNPVTGNANFNMRGLIAVTHADTQISFNGKRMEVEAPNAAGITQGYFSALNVENGKVFFDVDEIVDTYVPDPDDIDEHASVAMGIYWFQGDIHVKCRNLLVNNYYGLWGEDVTGTGSANFWYEGDNVVSTNWNAIYVKTEVGAKHPNYKSWFNIKNLEGGRVGLSGVGDSKVYYTGQKVSSLAGIAISSTWSMWADIQKVSGSNTLAILDGGENYLHVHEYEDLAANGLPGSVKVKLWSGKNELIGGSYRANNTNAIAFMQVIGGTNLLRDVRMDMRAAGGTNAWGIDMAATNLNALEIEGATILEAGTTTNSIYATNAQTVVNSGMLVVSTNPHPNVTLSGGMLVNNGTKTIFANKFAGNLMPTNATLSRALAIGADGIATNAATTQAELDFVSGVTAAIQTQFLAGTNNVAGLRTAFQSTSNAFLNVSNAHVALSNQVTALNTAFVSTSNAFLITSNGLINTSNQLTTLTAAVNAESNSVTSISNNLQNLKNLQQNILPSSTITLTTNNTTNVTASVTPGRFMGDIGYKTWRWAMCSGAGATFTGIGDSATISSTSSFLTNADTVITAPSVIMLSFGSSNAIAHVSGNLNYVMGKDLEFVAWGGPTNLLNCTYWCGLADQTAATFAAGGTNAAGNYIMARFSSLGAESTYQLISKDGSTQTISNSGVSTNNVYPVLRLQCDSAAGAVYLWVNGSRVATNTTHNPASGTIMRPMVIMTTNAGVTNGLRMAWYGIGALVP